MNDSILTTIATMLLGSFDSTTFNATNAFFTELVIGINTALSVLTQLGVGADEGFKITGTEETWEDFIQSSRVDVEMVKSYVYLKTKLMFDPPQNSFLVDSIKNLCNEFEFRINVQVDTKKSDS